MRPLEREASPRPVPPAASGQRGKTRARRKTRTLRWFLGGVLLGLLAALMLEPGPAPEPVAVAPPGRASASVEAASPVATAQASGLAATAARPATDAPLPASRTDAGPAPAADAGTDAAPGEVAPWSHPDPESARACPPGMLLVEGDWCPYLTELCAEWIDQKRDRCLRYIKPSVCHGRRIAKRFCIDRYEYPNEAGVLPAVMVSWLEARDACKVEGKRLCTDTEWTFACEGTENFPYPYGYLRAPDACNIDRPTVMPDFEAFAENRGVADEVFRLDQRVPSGSMARCVSPFGVHDMTGNVDEWVINEKGDPYRSGLKGGYFGKIRARCRPMTTDHNEWFRFYQAGFRCCAAAGQVPGDQHPGSGSFAARPVLP